MGCREANGPWNAQRQRNVWLGEDSRSPPCPYSLSPYSSPPSLNWLLRCLMVHQRTFVAGQDRWMLNPTNGPCSLCLLLLFGKQSGVVFWPSAPEALCRLGCPLLKLNPAIRLPWGLDFSTSFTTMGSFENLTRDHWKSGSYSEFIL